MSRSLLSILSASVFLALLSTAGDFVWANWRVRHLAFYGVIHGIVMFLAAGALLGARRGRVAMGALCGVAAGAAGALSFYGLAPVLGYSAMFVAWLIVWVILGITSQAGITGVVRGLAAAVLSGAAFYAVSGMWMPFNPRGLADYADHFVRWTIAFLPGFAALMIGAPDGPRRRSR
jgi:hypothetical protein